MIPEILLELLVIEPEVEIRLQRLADVVQRHWGVYQQISRKSDPCVHSPFGLYLFGMSYLNLMCWTDEEHHTVPTTSYMHLLSLQFLELSTNFGPPQTRGIPDKLCQTLMFWEHREGLRTQRGNSRTESKSDPLKGLQSMLYFLDIFSQISHKY